MKVAIYARVSTTDQNCEIQLRDLREYVTRRGWTSVGEFVDTGFSGAKASRPALDKLMRTAARHECECIVVTKIDRFSRSVLHLNQQLQDLGSAGVRFIATSQSIDTDERNPTTRLLLQILGAVAEFEREMIRERTAAGSLAYRKAYDKGLVGKRKQKHSKSGKDLPIGRPHAVIDQVRVRAMRESGASIRQIAAKFKVGVATVVRTLAACLMVFQYMVFHGLNQR